MSSFSYIDPSASAKDAVRFLIGDTNEHQPLLLDGEINYLLGQYQNVPLAAAIQATETIMAKFSRLVDEKVGQVDVKFGERIKNMQLLQQQLRERLAINGATPYAGGISHGDKQANASDSDRVRPDFTKHMMENHQNSTFIPDGRKNGNGST